MSVAFDGFGKKAIPFLKAIGFHQSREWFADNRDIFERELREPFGDLIEVLAMRLGQAGLGLTGDRKKSMFRINRDVRFSKDKRPYNQHLSAILSPDGTKTSQGVLFVYIGVDRCFAAVAWWQSQPALLHAMRQAVATRPQAFRSMVATAEKEWPGACRRGADEAPAARLRRRHRSGAPCSRAQPAFRRAPRHRSVRASTVPALSTNSSTSRCGQSRCSIGGGRSRDDLRRIDRRMQSPAVDPQLKRIHVTAPCGRLKDRRSGRSHGGRDHR